MLSPTYRLPPLAVSVVAEFWHPTGYRDPESQAFESWFGKPKERLVWRSEFETLEQARKEVADYIHGLPPPAALRPRLPDADRGAPNLEDGERLQKTAA
jgi:hypothetical protein